MKVLVVDVGGTHIKLLATGETTPIKITSGPKMTAKQMVKDVLVAAKSWKYEAISIGYPGVVVHDAPVHEPHNLGPGWVNFDYQKALGKPVKMLNDAAMQALGAYEGGRMLFLGLGTGLGSAVIAEGIIAPMELAHLPYRGKHTYEDMVGDAGLKHLGEKRWKKRVMEVISLLKAAVEADYVVLGGGNARLLDKVPPDVKLGGNADAFKGGFRLWDTPASPTTVTSRKNAPVKAKAKAKKKATRKKTTK